MQAVLADIASGDTVVQPATLQALQAADAALQSADQALDAANTANTSAVAAETADVPPPGN